MLDDVSLRTPLENDLTIRNRTIAHIVKSEWSKVKKEINYLHMPYTKACFLSVDRSEGESLQLKEKLVAYGMSDLLCYRADKGSDLARVQSKNWDPLIDWIQIELGMTLIISHGLMPVEQSKGLEEALSKLLLQIDPLSLTALDELVTLSNSLIIGLAILKEKILPEKAWVLMRVDEDWQRQIWGTVVEQKLEDEIKKSCFRQACEILQMIRKG